MAIWLDTGKSIVGLKEQLMAKQVYLQTEIEFYRAKDLSSKTYLIMIYLPKSSILSVWVLPPWMKGKLNKG
ncbi:MULTISPECIES: hypothetical protein [Colwellia]|uniref:hypothetical protein n=1 Tax=Colwellia TaxID=28228 RepID=UPI00070F698F|nr:MULTISPECIES: hypothetical protein [Colwellia]